MRTFLLPLIACAMAPFALAAESSANNAATSPAPVAAPAEEMPFKAGDAAPAALLPSVWLRGEPVKEFRPGVTYVLVLWNTRGVLNFAPGYNIARTMKSFEADEPVKGIVVFLLDDIAPEKLAKRLSRPSQRSAFPVGHAEPGSECEKAFTRLYTGKSRMPHNAMVVRDGRIVWVGEAGDLNPDGLRPILKPDFNFETHVKKVAAERARTGELLRMLSTDLSNAEKAKDSAKVQEILSAVEAEPDLNRAVYTRLRDTKCGMAMERGDVAGALAEMRLLADKYPTNAATQAWVHKVVTQTEEFYKPGLALSAQVAERMATIREVENASAWWSAAAKYRLELGDKPGALAALEEARRTSAPYQRLEAMKKAAN